MNSYRSAALETQQRCPLLIEAFVDPVQPCTSGNQAFEVTERPPCRSSSTARIPEAATGRIVCGRRSKCQRNDGRGKPMPYSECSGGRHSKYILLLLAIDVRLSINTASCNASNLFLERRDYFFKKSVACRRSSRRISVFRSRSSSVLERRMAEGCRVAMIGGKPSACCTLPCN